MGWVLLGGGALERAHFLFRQEEQTNTSKCNYRPLGNCDRPTNRPTDRPDHGEVTLLIRGGYSFHREQVQCVGMLHVYNCYN